MSAPVSPDDPHAVLRDLIAPVDPARFYAEYWESKPLVVHRQRPDAFTGVLTLADIDRVVTSMQLRHPDIQAVDASKTLRAEDYTFPSGMIDPTRLFQLFGDGATLILPQLDQKLPALADLCRGMEREINQRFQTNIYVTPGNAQGFRTHFDSHDVFILQVVGHKHWVLYDTPVELPYRNQRFQTRQYAPGNVTLEFDMEPGDVAYIPRGVMHDAATTGGVTSMHVTLGVLAVSWTDLMVEALARVGLKDPAFRKALPPGFARTDFGGRDEARAFFRDLWKRASESAGFDDALDFFADDFRSTRHPLVWGQIDQVEKLRGLAAGSRVRPRPNLILRIVETPEHAVLECYGQSLRFPLHTAVPLRAAVAGACVVGELPGPLDEAGKLVLVRRLVREGVLELE